MDSGVEGFIRLMTNPLKFRMFLFKKLPSAFFAGVRIKSMDAGKCEVTIPYKWFSQNPFRSTYFACLSMAAEMSTGVLSMAYVYRKSPAISMLVTAIEGSFLKKATGITTFTCEDGPLIRQAIADAITSGEGRQVKARSTGRNADGNEVAEFYITWSFKAKK